MSGCAVSDGNLANKSSGTAHEVSLSSTGDDVKRRIDLHLTAYFGGQRMSAITSTQVRAYVTARLEQGARPATVNRELAIQGSPALCVLSS